MVLSPGPQFSTAFRLSRRWLGHALICAPRAHDPGHSRCTPTSGHWCIAAARRMSTGSRHARYDLSSPTTQMTYGPGRQVTNIDDQHAGDRVMIMTGNSVGLALMRADDIATFARWNQDLEFTALLGTPGEAHTFEMRQE